MVTAAGHGMVPRAVSGWTTRAPPKGSAVATPTAPSPRLLVSECCQRRRGRERRATREWRPTRGRQKAHRVRARHVCATLGAADVGTDAAAAALCGFGRDAHRAAARALTACNCLGGCLRGSGGPAALLPGTSRCAAAHGELCAQPRPPARGSPVHTYNRLPRLARGGAPRPPARSTAQRFEAALAEVRAARHSVSLVPVRPQARRTPCLSRSRSRRCPGRP